MKKITFTSSLVSSHVIISEMSFGIGLFIQFKMLHSLSYYFVDNGDDGKEATLDSKTAKCTMFFAVHVTQDNKKAIYGMDFAKPGIINLMSIFCTKVGGMTLSRV